MLQVLVAKIAAELVLPTAKQLEDICEENGLIFYRSDARSNSVYFYFFDTEEDLEESRPVLERIGRLYFKDGRTSEDSTGSKIPPYGDDQLDDEIQAVPSKKTFGRTIYFSKNNRAVLKFRISHHKATESEKEQDRAMADMRIDLDDPANFELKVRDIFCQIRAKLPRYIQERVDEIEERRKFKKRFLETPAPAVVENPKKRKKRGHRRRDSVFDLAFDGVKNVASGMSQ